MPPISFNQVPTAIRVPFAYIEFSNQNAQRGPAIQPYTGLIFGQMLSSGTATANQLVLVSNPSQAAVLFGKGSMLARMFEKWFANNELTPVYAMPLADAGGGVKAIGNLSLTGPATAAGTLNVYIGGRLVQVAVASGDTAATVATNIVAAITARAAAADDLPVTAAVDGSITFQVDFTAKHKGVLGNSIDIRCVQFSSDSIPAGLAITFSAMATGAGNPSLTTAIANLPETQFNVIAFPYVDSTNAGAIQTELASRAGPLRQIEGSAISAMQDSLSNLATLGAANNAAYFSIVGSYKDPSPPDELAAVTAANVAYYGNIDPARPFNTLPMNGFMPAKLADRLTLAERNTLLFDGIATFKIDSSGAPLMERVITTYQKNGAGAADASYLDIQTLLTLSYLRYDLRNTVLTKYPRVKLADDGVRTGPGSNIVTPNTFRAEVIAKFTQWQDLGLCENSAEFKANLVVERNESDPTRLDVLLPPQLVSQFNILGAQIAFLL